MSPNSQSTTDYLRQEWQRRHTEAEALLRRHEGLQALSYQAAGVMREAAYSSEHDFRLRMGEYLAAVAEARQSWWEYRNASRREFQAYERYNTYSRSGLDLAGVEA